VQDPGIPNISLGAYLGGGGFGKVYRGRHETLHVDVAVKLVDPKELRGHIDDGLEEARLMARLDHPNLLRIFDAGRSAQGMPYLVLELMDGTCKELKRLPAERAVHLLRQLLAGLQALHDARILHRDIKPANCLVRHRDDRVKLADLGIAMEQRSKTQPFIDRAGTLPFMAPELFEPVPDFSPISDLYALGMTMQCMLRDVDPFPAGHYAEVIRWVRTRSPFRIAERRPDLPPDLCALIDQMTAPAPDDRPRSAADALARVPSGVPKPVHRVDPEPLAPQIGAWILEAEMPRGGNFREYAVSHAQTGSAARLAVLRSRRPLSHASALVLASAERASRLSHPGIVDVIDWGLHDERAFVVTHPQGRSLRMVVDASRGLGELEAVELARALADALAYLHDAGLVYQVVIPDFAVLARDARSAQLAWPLFCAPTGSTANPAPGTALTITVPRFAAPESLVRPSRAGDGDPPHGPPTDEQPRMVDRYEIESGIRREPAPPVLHPAVDLYGLGETLYYLIAGRPAFSDTPDITSLVLEKMRGPARLRDAVPTVTAPTAHLVAELTAPRQADRPANAGVVRDELNRIAGRLGATRRG
jgi:serine/threonine protein kinase